MANYSDLKSAVAAVIKANGNNEITGTIMQNTLLSIIETIGGNRTFVGLASPSTNPGTPDANVFYLTSTPGVYPNFGGATIEFGDLHILQNSAANAWQSIRIYRLGLKLIDSKNMFNPDTVQVGKYQPSTVQNLVSAAGWSCSAFIPVTVGTTYYISGNKQRVGVGMYNSAFQCVRYIAIVTGAVTAQTGEAYCVFNLESPAQPGYSNVQFEVGSSATPYEPFGKIVSKEGVEGLEQAMADSQAALTASQTAVEETVEINDKIRAFEFDTIASTNLLNPNAVTPNSLINDSNGTLLIDPGDPTVRRYNTTDFMPVNPSTAYRMLNINGSTYARKVAFYNALKVFVSGLDNPGTNIPVPAGAAYCRISMNNASPMNGYGFFEGAGATWEPFGGNAVKLVDDNVPTNDKENNAIASIADVKAIASQSTAETAEQIQYTLAGTNLTINYGDGNVVTGFVGNDRGFSGNNMFSFNGYNINGVAGSNGDDVAPMHALNTTIGANHGQPYNNGTVTAHGLDNTAIGTEWTNGSGTKFYIMRIVNADTIAFLGQNNGTAASPNFASLSTGTLTRGGNTLTVSDVNGAQLYPAIKNLNIKVLANGVNEVTSGNGSAKFLDVVESYEITSVDSVLQNTIARAGTSGPAVYDGDAFAVVENIYRFVPGLACVIIVNVRFLQSVAFNDIMANQAIRVGTNGVTQYYIPNSNPIPAGDFRTPLAITWGSGTSSGYITNTAMPDPDNPPNRIINYFNDLGFSLGYITTKGTGKAINEFSARSFELRNNTGKIYPHPVEGTKVGNPVTANSIFNTVMFRAFTDLTVSRVGNRLSYFAFPFDGKHYVYIDYSGSMVDKLDLNNQSLNGKDITVVESKNTELKTDTYNDGVYINATYVAGETCYIVLTIG